MRKITIAIDGYSSCGKSTMAHTLALKIGYTHIDTGAMYRAVTLHALRKHLIADDGQIDVTALEKELPCITITQHTNADGKTETFLNNDHVEREIRSIEVSNHVSAIAALPSVRAVLTQLQRNMGENGGIVMDGRDIGTAVFPDAELKIFVTATADVRAKRRYDELKSKGQEVDFKEILHNVETRDYIDSHREVAPLRQADDAIVLDNSEMTLQEQDEWLLNKYEETVLKLAGNKE